MNGFLTNRMWSRHADAQEKLLQELVDNDFHDDMDVTPELVSLLFFGMIACSHNER